MRAQPPPDNDAIRLLQGQMHFLARSARDMQKHIAGTSEEVRRTLLEYPWPGNVRELRNAVERAVLLCRGAQVELSDLPAELRWESSGRDSDEEAVDILEQIEHRTLREALQAHAGNVSATARALGMPRGKLRYRMRKHHLNGG